MRLLHLLVASSIAMLLSFNLGCSDPESAWDRIPLTGNVTVNNRPYSGGISFVPVSGGPAAGTDCTAGTYRFSRRDGPVVGAYAVMLMPTAGSPLDGESLELTIDIPQQPPYEVDLKFQLANDRDWPLENNASATGPGNTSAPGYAGPNSAGGATGTPSAPNGSVGSPQTSKPAEESTDKKRSSEEEAEPTRGPAGSY
jgi:hypothetical protein